MCTTACYYNYVEIVEWFVEIKPDLYYVEIEDETIIDFGIYNELNILDKKKVDIIKECNICYDNNSDCVTNCNHQFCYSCLGTWYKRKTTCPYCRRDILSVFNI